MTARPGLFALALALVGLGLAAAPAQGRRVVAIKAGRIALVDEGRFAENATLLIEDGRIRAVGSDVDASGALEVIDYGPDAVIVPGLVAAHSNLGLVFASDRTADAAPRALDSFDFYAEYVVSMACGVTTAYVAPARGRLIAGQGALVKLAGDDEEARVVAAPAAVHGAIDESARGTPGYWEPPVPASADQDIGFRQAQLPGSTMGAIVALDEILSAAEARRPAAGFGPGLSEELRSLLDAKTPWRITANEENEIRALLDLARRHGLPLVIDGAVGAAPLATEIAAAGASVIFRVPFAPNDELADYGKERDARWPAYDVPATLVRAGVKVAIACDVPRDLAFAAALASRGGLSEMDALRAVTLTPAEIYGVGKRIGSLAPGKDADFAVLSGGPLSGSVLASWVDGELAWQPPAARMERGTSDAPSSASAAPPVVLSVDELYVGDGRVIAPAEILMDGGRIAEVGARVGRPFGATVIHGRAAMPGMIDALSYLGLEGASRAIGPDFKLSRVVDPGDRVDRRVARSGVTTVVLTSRRVSGNGSPMMAYKPAGEDFDRQVVGDPVAIQLEWPDRNRNRSGKGVVDLLEKAREYVAKWREYEQALAAWKPPAAPADERADEAEDERRADADERAEPDQGRDKDKRADKKRSDAEPEPDPITGLWEAEVARPPRTELEPFRMRLELQAGEGSASVVGNLRCRAVSDDLVDVEGYWDRAGLTLALSGLGTLGWVDVAVGLEDERLVGTLTVGGTELDLAATRTAREYPKAARPERLAAEEGDEEPKGKPRPPKRDERLEPLRAAFAGEAAVVVAVEREDEILECVDALEGFGIKPILLGARDLHWVADRVAGRIAGVLLSEDVLRYEPERGARPLRPYAQLQRAGIKVAFHSAAEEGAAGLPVVAAYAASQGLGPTAALRALTADVAAMFAMDEHVGAVEPGRDADVLLLDGPALQPATSVVRVFVNGREVR